jgi:penicillin-binding protein 2
VPIAPNRGLIYDRNGILLAENRPIFNLEIIPEQVKDMDDTSYAYNNCCRFPKKK